MIGHLQAVSGTNRAEYWWPQVPVILNIPFTNFGTSFTWWCSLLFATELLATVTSREFLPLGLHSKLWDWGRHGSLELLSGQFLL